MLQYYRMGKGFLQDISVFDYKTGKGLSTDFFLFLSTPSDLCSILAE